MRTTVVLLAVLVLSLASCQNTPNPSVPNGGNNVVLNFTFNLNDDGDSVAPGTPESTCDMMGATDNKDCVEQATGALSFGDCNNNTGLDKAEWLCPNTYKDCSGISSRCAVCMYPAGAGHVAAIEFCDGVDNNCDGKIDNDCVGCMVAADCNDNDACTTDTCGVDHQCGHVAVDTNDNDLCTTDSCDPLTGPIRTTVTCAPDNLACTTDTCDPALGCVNTPFTPCCENDDGCEDAEYCGVDHVCAPVLCGGGTFCRPILPIGHECTDNDKPNGTPCLNSTVCDGNESCQAGICSPGTVLDCNDGLACTNDSCDPALGCVHDPVVTDPVCCEDSTDCNDGSACTADVCSNHVCYNNPISCDDGDACTTDSCSPTLGCKFDPIPFCCFNDAGCDSSRPATLPATFLWGCTENDSDVAGTCTSCEDDGDGVCGDQLVCDDGLDGGGHGLVDCQDPVCQGKTCRLGGICGFNSVTNDRECVDAPPECTPDCTDKTCGDDGCGGTCGTCAATTSTCTCNGNNLVCQDFPGVCQANGTCVVTTTTACPVDQNVCTTDACVQGACVHTPNNLPCDDGDLCTLDDECKDGAVCFGGPTKDCSDNDPNTADTCVPATGACVHTVIPTIPESVLQVVWTNEPGQIPAGSNNLILVAACYSMPDYKGTVVLPWAVYATGPKNVAKLTLLESVPEGVGSCKVNVTNDGGTWWAYRTEAVPGVLVKTGNTSYLYNDGTTMTIAETGAKSNGQGGFDAYMAPGTDNDGDAILNGADPCPNTAATTCAP